MRQEITMMKGWKRHIRTYARNAVKEKEREIKKGWKEEREQKLYARGEKWIGNHSETALRMAEEDERERHIFNLLLERGVEMGTRSKNPQGRYERAERRRWWMAMSALTVLASLALWILANWHYASIAK